jgi:hypothetical protein
MKGFSTKIERRELSRDEISAISGGRFFFTETGPVDTSGQIVFDQAYFDSLVELSNQPNIADASVSNDVTVPNTDLSVEPETVATSSNTEAISNSNNVSPRVLAFLDSIRDIPFSFISEPG